VEKEMPQEICKEWRGGVATVPVEGEDIKVEHPALEEVVLFFQVESITLRYKAQIHIQQHPINRIRIEELLD
jgi:hypothetical protein